MKKQIILIALAVATSFLGCKKQKFESSAPQDSQSTPSNALSHSLRVGSYPGVSVTNGLITFDNLTTFRSTADRLIAEDDNYVRTDSLAPEDTVAYKQFELSFNYNSLRAKIEALRQPWLNTADLTVATDPANNYIVGEIMQTFLNENSAFRIANKIYVIVPNFDLYEINDGNVATYNAIVGGQRTNLPNTKLYKTDGSIINAQNGSVLRVASECKSMGFKYTSTYYASGNRQLVTRITLYNFPFLGYVSSQSENFRRKGSNSWTPNKANTIKAGIFGTLYSANCGENGSVNVLHTKYFSSVVSRNLLYWGQIIKYVNPNLTGTGYASDAGSSATNNAILP